jgi:Flp pilus assembly protein TadD
LLGLIARQLGDTDQAITAFRKSLSVNPDSPETLFMLGQELQRKGDTQSARQVWEKAIEIRPQYSQVIYNLSRLLAKSDPEQSRQLQARFEKIQSDQHIMDRAQSLGNFALTSADAHDWPQAIAQLKEAIEVCGDCSARSQLHKDLGLIYCRSGSFSDGRAELFEAQKLAPGDQDVEKALRLLDAAQKAQ